MAQEQPRWSQPDMEPIKYGDVFNVEGDLASQAVAPQDAVSMQAVENRALSDIPRGGPASVMLSAAAVNARAGLVDRNDASDEVRDKGTSVMASNVGGDCIVTEFVAGQVVAQYIEQGVPRATPGSLDLDAVTVGEALEATALATGDKPIGLSDAAAIQAAEVRATGLNQILPGGLGAQAQSAAIYNPRVAREDDKITIGDVLGDATQKLPGDAVVTTEVAEGVIQAEVRNKLGMRASPGGVAAAMAAAARLNQGDQR